jgi:hypothetical protein
VAVGRLLGDVVVRQVAAGAALVVDDHRLAQRLLHRLLDGARQRIGAAARRKRDDDLDRL